MNKKVLFFGTSKISVAVLDELLITNVSVIGVVSQQPKKANHNKITKSEMQIFCEEKNIKVFLPNKSKEIIDEIKILSPELIIVCSYGEIIPQDILNIPKFGCINIHTSLLPKYRGAAPINYAIMNNEKETGITLMYMDKNMDTGDIIKQETISIMPNETYSSLYEKMSILGRRIIKENIDSLFSINIPRTKQDNALATYTKKIERKDEMINFNKKAVEVECLIRSLYSTPIAYANYQKQPIKIHQGNIVDFDSDEKPGTIIKIDKEGMLVATAKSCILITTLQIPSKKPVEVKNMINGNHFFKIGTKFNF
ncbi:MAG: methionyl-tRNA formyltransferase [Mycoplasmataceae bacterium]|jgi:methionyl-tRNA formyltransferase|nr:methionyl-tRNA formyltransferase [Mycoplasmataceae bacterium]